MPDAEGPLAGTLVLDLSRVLAGPTCAQILGDLGADVVKVERPGSGDDTRGWGPPFAGGESAYFMCANRNKKSVTLDLASEAGLGVLKKLIAAADVVVENFRPGTLARWGLDEDWFASAAPRAVLCSVTGYGSRGPKAQLPGYDFLAQAESGLMSINGAPDGEPTKFGVSIVDFCTGQYAAIAILAALQARSRTGRGQRIDANLYCTGLSMLINVGASHLMSGKPARRLGNGHPNAVPYREYACADAALALPVGNDAQFARLAAVLGHPEWAEDPRFATMAGRVENREAVDAMLEEAFAARPAGEWIAALQAQGLAVSLIATVAEALSDPHALANEMVVEVEHAAAGAVRLLGVPYTLSDTPAAVRAPPPRLGEHTESVLAELAGLSAEEIASLRAAGVA